MGSCGEVFRLRGFRIHHLQLRNLLHSQVIAVFQSSGSEPTVLAVCSYYWLRHRTQDMLELGVCKTQESISIVPGLILDFDLSCLSVKLICHFVLPL